MHTLSLFLLLSTPHLRNPVHYNSRHHRHVARSTQIPSTVVVGDLEPVQWQVSKVAPALPTPVGLNFSRFVKNLHPAVLLVA